LKLSANTDSDTNPVYKIVQIFFAPIHIYIFTDDLALLSSKNTPKMDMISILLTDITDIQY